MTLNRELEKNDDLFFYTIALNSIKSNIVFYAYNPTEFKKYVPYILVENRYVNDNFPLELFGLTIEDDPQIICDSNVNISEKDIQKIKNFIIDNKKLLLDHWYYKIDDYQLLSDERMKWI